MNVLGLGIGRLTDDQHQRLLRAAADAPLTYDHVGSTLDAARWDGPAMTTRHVDVGAGEAAFDTARTALLTWVPQRTIGADVVPAGQPVRLGETVLVILRRGPFHVVAPNRVVALMDEHRRFAFAYGTLPGHPERGEESFMVERQPDDTVRLTIRVQAVPATVVARAAAPIARRLQSAALNGYLKAVADHVAMSVAGSGPNSSSAD